MPNALTGLKKPEPEHSLGKGEVDSSILSSSTTKAHEIRASDDTPKVPIGSLIRNEARNAQLHTWKIRGLCSRHVHLCVLTGPLSDFKALVSHGNFGKRRWAARRRRWDARSDECRRIGS